MYRVVTKYLDRRRHWIVEHGPWHESRSDAEHWAEMLRWHGYQSEVEGQHGLIADQHGDHALHDALANMA